MKHENVVIADYMSVAVDVCLFIVEFRASSCYRDVELERLCVIYVTSQFTTDGWSSHCEC